ncbi:hypothetical protein [Candidatus Ferrigenium straubiae]|mgnify:CR=1 FL=1|jgi:hypothetical protein|uniref:hypothetical protein n=1 Tax=Candidatus Ferrigenium straubiae TaxID=2919506 RepID=UPI003F4AE615
MTPKTVLFATLFALLAATAAGAGEPGADKPAASQGEEKTGSPEGEHKLDFKELFGCEPMGEDGHPMPKPASGVEQQETMQPRQ